MRIRAEMMETIDAMGEGIEKVGGAKVGFGEIARIGQAGQSFTAIRDVTVLTIRCIAVDSRSAETNPLSPLSHTYRFAKMHDKVHSDLHDEIEPFVIHTLPSYRD